MSRVTLSPRSLTAMLVVSTLVLLGTLVYLLVLRPLAIDEQRRAAAAAAAHTQRPDGDNTQAAAAADAGPASDAQDVATTDAAPNGSESAPRSIHGEPLPTPIEPLSAEQRAYVREMAAMLAHAEPVTTGDGRQRVPAEIAAAELQLTDWRAVPILEEALAHATDTEHRGRLQELIQHLRHEPYGVASSYYFPHAWLDNHSRLLYAEAIAREPGDNPLTCLITGPRGREHNALFELRGSGRHVAELLKRLPLRATDPVAQPQFPGDWVLYNGGTVSIRVRYRSDRGPVERPIEEFLRAGDQTLATTGWAYLGAPLGDSGQAVADETGIIAALHTRPEAILANPWPNSRDADAFRAGDRRLPAGTPVQLVFVPEPPAARSAQHDSLFPAWQAWLPARRQILAERGLADTSDEVLAQVLNERNFDPSAYAFAPLVPPLTDAESRTLEELLNTLAHADTPPAEWQEARETLAALDSRYVPLIERAYRDRNEERLRDAITPQLLEQLSITPIEREGILYWVGFALDPEQGVLIADATVSPLDGTLPLEFAVCSMKGKHHESLFALHGHPYNLEQALDRLGLRRSQAVPLREQDWVPYDGDFVVIEAAWRRSTDAAVPEALAGRAVMQAAEGVEWWRLEDLIRDGRADARTSMPRTGFAYVGSAFTPEGVHLAEANGGVVGVYQRGEYAVLENPWIESARPHHYHAWRDRVPRANWPVRLYFSAEPAEARVERDAQLAEVWRDVRLQRPRIEVAEIPDGWRQHWRRGIWRWMGPGHAFVHVQPDFNRWGEIEVGEGYRELVREKIAFENDNQQEYLFEQDVEMWGMPAWRFAYRDTDGQISQRLIAVNRRFFYDVVFFVPNAREPLETLRQRFDDWLAWLDVGWPENRWSYMPAHEIRAASLTDTQRLEVTVVTAGEQLPRVQCYDILETIVERLAAYDTVREVVGEVFATQAAYDAWRAAGGNVRMAFVADGAEDAEPYGTQDLELVPDNDNNGE